MYIPSLFKVFDSRFDAYRGVGNRGILLHDLMSGMVLALMAVPLAIAIAASVGIDPASGVIACVMGSVIGALFGGSRYQIYGPTGAFIPVVAAILHTYNTSFLLLVTLISGSLLIIGALLNLGRYVSLIPRSVMVGLSMGIAVSLVISQLQNIFGETEDIGHSAFEQLWHLPGMFVHAHAHAVLIAIFTFLVIRWLNRISILIPGALIAMLVSTYVANSIWHDHLVPVVATNIVRISNHIGSATFQSVMPSLSHFPLVDLILPVISVVLIASLESLPFSQVGRPNSRARRVV